MVIGKRPAKFLWRGGRNPGGLVERVVVLDVVEAPRQGIDVRTSHRIHAQVVLAGVFEVVRARLDVIGRLIDPQRGLFLHG